MKKIIYFVSIAALFAVSTSVKAQQQATDAYRRSSICLILMDEEGMPKRDIIKNAFLEAPVPDKYNDHNLGIRTFDPSKLLITAEDRLAYGTAVNAGKEVPEGQKEKKKGGGIGKFMKEAGGAALGAASGKDNSVLVDNTSKEDYAVKSLKHLLDNKAAKQMFDKWFINGGKFSMDMVKERGLYDASVLDIQTAKSSVRGMGMLEDAGEELIGNTFVVVSRYRYLSKDELIQEVEANARLIASQLGGYAQLGVEAAVVAAKATMGAGYYVRITSFLFQLDWNDDISNTFYSNLWDNHSAYNSADIFKLKYVGQEMAWANVKAGVFTKKSEDELIKMATINATDAVLAKLEKQYDVFKTKTPLLSIDPLTAAIGMKEGLEAGDKYEVLEKIVDPETNKTTYKRKGVLKVSKDQLWDNRFGASEELELAGKTQNFTTTKFEGDAKGLYPGMLLRQIK